MSAPRLLIVADDPKQRIAIAEAVRRCGFDVLHNIHSSLLKPEHCKLSPSLWLLDVEDVAEILDVLGDNVPLMVGIIPAPSPMTRKAYDKWIQSLSRKLNQILGNGNVVAVSSLTVEYEEHHAKVSGGTLQRPLGDLGLAIIPPDWQYVCILAASMGGPEAVKRFLDHLPVTLPVAFVLVQHIDPNMQVVLPRVLGRHNKWQFDTEKNFAQPTRDRGSTTTYPDLLLLQGRVLVVPALRQIDFGNCGEVFADPPISMVSMQYEPWSGQYQPSINEVMRRAAKAFGSRLITIVFSGMGDDGSAAVHTVREAHGMIWAQTAESCVCASQPDHVRASGHVSFSGSPEVLAVHLQKFIAQHSTS